MNPSIEPTNAAPPQYRNQENYKEIKRYREGVIPGLRCDFNASIVALMTFIGFRERVTRAAKSVMPAQRQISKMYCWQRTPKPFHLSRQHDCMLVIGGKMVWLVITRSKIGRTRLEKK